MNGKVESMHDHARWSRYFSPTAAHRHLGLYCLGAGRQSGRTPPTQHRVLDCYAAVLVAEGSGELWWAGAHSPVRIRGPVLFWLFPGVAHSYAPLAQGWAEEWVLFDGVGPRSYEDLGFLSRSHPVQQLRDPGRLPSLFDQIIDRCADPTSQADVEAAADVHQLIIEARQSRRADEGPKRSDPLVSKLLAQSCTPLSIAEHALRLGVSVASLREAVRASGTEGPKELVLRARLDHATALLTTTSLSVQQVAHEVGYHDPAYFTRLFTRRMGIPPRAFRQRHLGDVRRGDGGDGAPTRTAASGSGRGSEPHSRSAQAPDSASSSLIPVS